MKLISAEKLLKELKELPMMVVSGYGAEEYVRKKIEEMEPEEDAVKVMRCSECMFFNKKHNRCVILDTDKEPQGYCNEAVRRSK